MFIDTHCHTLDPRFDSDRQSVFERAATSGVMAFIEVGCAQEQWQRAIDFTRQQPGRYCALGIHPQEAKDATPEAMALLATLARADTVVAIGETGLDYFHEHSPRDVQKDVFKQHLSLARSLDKPVSIHCRDAYADLLALLKEAGDVRGVIHCFSGSVAEARELVSRGLFLGIDGPVTYPKATTLKEAAKEIPLEHLLLETDCPYLPPQSFRGKRNEPSYLPFIAREIAGLKGISPEAVEETTTRNARSLFKLPGASS